MSSSSSSAAGALSIPTWAVPGVARQKYGKAKALGADNATLSDPDLTVGYLQAKDLGMYLRFIHMLGLGLGVIL